MAIPLRAEYEGAFYHVTIRGNDRKNYVTVSMFKRKSQGLIQ